MVRLSQSAKYVGAEGLHQWQCRFEISGSPADVGGIERVVYTLDRSFPNPVREVTDRDTRFALELLCWASFPIFASVHHADGKVDLLRDDVALPLPEDAEVESVPEEDESQPLRYAPPVLLMGEADAVLDGGGVRAVAFSGALEAAEEEGVERWVNLAGSSAGALVASLLAVGYRPAEISAFLLETDHARLFGWRAGGVIGKLTAGWGNRGLIQSKHLRSWLEERFAKSRVGTPKPTFGDLAALSADTTDRTRHRLRIIVSDLTSARMVVFPDELEDYETASGEPIVSDEYSLVDAVLMSMSIPFWFQPFVLHRDGAPHYLMDGGLLSNFPIWLFDNAYPARPTWGVRLRREGTAVDEEARRPKTAVAMARALISAVTEAARELEPTRNVTRTLTVPVRADLIGPQLTRAEVQDLRDIGYQEGRAFFASRGAYLNSLGRGLPESALVAPPATELRRRKTASNT